MTAPHPAALGAIHGIADYWALRTMRASHPAASDMADRILLDVLGLGITQAHMFLGGERPDFPAFEAWVIATAGPPDPLRVARYDAWATGVPVPEVVQRQLSAIDAMPPVLDADDLEHWDAHGYVVLRAAIDRAEAAAAEALLWRLLDANPNDSASWYGPTVAGIMTPYFQDPVLEIARRSARIHKAFAQLLGTSDLWASTDRLGFNPPEKDGYPFQGTGLHWDTSLAQPIPLTTGGILYLTDTGADQGAFRCVPGFHRRIAGWLDAIGDADPRQIDLSDQAVPIPGKAGDLVIWRHELPHGASPNTADRPRMVQYVNRYAPHTAAQSLWR